MNTLSYGLLGLLASEALSGYDLTLRANVFWRTTHSRIYPLLSKLEQEGYINFVLIMQSDKPDKKIYSLTEKGLEAVKGWLQSPTDESVTKDEFFFKIYCMYVLDNDGVNKLLSEKEEMYNNRLKNCQERLTKLKVCCDGKLKNTNSTEFGRYITLQKAIGDALWGIKWCNWVREIYDSNDDINIFDLVPYHMDIKKD